jgi:hypothetical protein
VAIHELGRGDAVGLAHGHTHRAALGRSTRSRSAEPGELRGEPRSGEKAKCRSHLGLVIYRKWGRLHGRGSVDRSQHSVEIRKILIGTTLPQHVASVRG